MIKCGFLNLIIYLKSIVKDVPFLNDLLLDRNREINEIIFMSINFDYSFRGILQVPIRALRAKKIFVASLFLAIGLVCVYLFTGLAFLVDGGSSSTIPILFGLVSVPIFVFPGFWAMTIIYIGIFLAMLSVGLGILAIAAFDFEELRGNHFFSAGEAIKFSFSRVRQLFLSWLGIALFIGFIILLGFLVGLIIHIPYIGEIIFSIFFFFPNFIIALFTVLVIFVFLLSFLVMPAAVAADQNNETFNSILESFSTIIRQPIRWTAYTLYSIITAKLAGFVFAYFAYRAVQLLIFSTRLGGGDKINGLISAGLSHLPLGSDAIIFTTYIFPGIDFGIDFSQLGAATTDGSIAGYIMAVSFGLVFLTIWGYMFSVIATGQSCAFAVIKKIRDGHLISDEKSQFYEEEWVNPPIEKDTSPE
jgi:hypothetical protein